MSSLPLQAGRTTAQSAGRSRNAALAKPSEAPASQPKLPRPPLHAHKTPVRAASSCRCNGCMVLALYNVLKLLLVGSRRQ